VIRIDHQGGEKSFWITAVDLWNLVDTVAGNYGGVVDWSMTDFSDLFFEGPPEKAEQFYHAIQELQEMVKLGERYRKNPPRFAPK